MYRATLVSLLLLCGLLAGCSAVSPFSTLTKLDVVLTASEHVNPDLHGRPSPVVVQLIELRHGVAFEHADFFSLYERVKETLAADLVTTEELELRPGETVDLKLSVESASRYVGVLAAYRDLMDTQWHYTFQITPAQVTDVDLTLDQSGIRNTHELLVKAAD